LIRNLGLSPIRPFFYTAIGRGLSSFENQAKSRKYSTVYYEFRVGWGGTLSRYIEALVAYSKDHRQDLVKKSKVLLFDTFTGLPKPAGIEDINHKTN
jgi:hypothetical protein